MFPSEHVCHVPPECGEPARRGFWCGQRGVRWLHKELAGSGWRWVGEEGGAWPTSGATRPAQEERGHCQVRLFVIQSVPGNTSHCVAQVFCSHWEQREKTNVPIPDNATWAVPPKQWVNQSPPLLCPVLCHRCCLYSTLLWKFFFNLLSMLSSEP